MAESYAYYEEEKNRIFRISFWLVLPIFLIVLLFGLARPGGYAAAQSPGFHGNFSEDTHFCLVCHEIHDAPGAKLERFTPESAICFTCHNGTGSMLDTQAQMNNSPASNAMHPIIVNLSNNSGIYNYAPDTTAGIAPAGPYNCSQCHEPHGDIANGKLLKARYDTSEYVSYPSSPDPYALCWNCHGSSQIFNDQTYFKEHSRHIINDNAPCSACHFSPHGVAFVAMVRFDPGYVVKSLASNSGPTFTSDGSHRGSCTLTCHGKDHDQVPY